MEDIKELEKLKLTKNERKVYLTLLEIGSVTVSDLVKKTGLHRSYIYDILDKIIELGLVSFVIKNNIKYFKTENPERLLQILDANEQEIKENKKELKRVLPKLIERQNKSINNQEARIFLGKEGIKSILEDILKTKKDFVAFGAEGKFKEVFKWYFDNWQLRRVKTKIKYKIVYNSSLKGERPLKEQKLTEVRFLNENYEFPSTIIAYGDKVAIIIWDFQAVGFVLESDKASKSFENYFNLLWKQAKP